MSDASVGGGGLKRTDPKELAIFQLHPERQDLWWSGARARISGQRLSGLSLLGAITLAISVLAGIAFMNADALSQAPETWTSGVAAMKEMSTHRLVIEGIVVPNITLVAAITAFVGLQLLILVSWRQLSPRQAVQAMMKRRGRSLDVVSMAFADHDAGIVAHDIDQFLRGRLARGPVATR